MSRSSDRDWAIDLAWRLAGKRKLARNLTGELLPVDLIDLGLQLLRLVLLLLLWLTIGIWHGA